MRKGESKSGRQGPGAQREGEGPGAQGGSVASKLALERKVYLSVNELKAFRVNVELG